MRGRLNEPLIEVLIDLTKRNYSWKISNVILRSIIVWLLTKESWSLPMSMIYILFRPTMCFVYRWPGMLAQTDIKSSQLNKNWR